MKKYTVTQTFRAQIGGNVHTVEQRYYGQQMFMYVVDGLPRYKEGWEFTTDQYFDFNPIVIN